MTLAEIVKNVARKYGVPSTLAGGFIYAAFEELVRVVDSGEQVKIRGLGTFQWRPVAERRSSGAWEGGQVPPGFKLKFKPARRFRSRRENVRRRGYDEVWR